MEEVSKMERADIFDAVSYHGNMYEEPAPV